MTIKPQQPVDDTPPTPPVQRAPFGGFADRTAPQPTPEPEEPKGE
jgi:hypothetical protein